MSMLCHCTLCLRLMPTIAFSNMATAHQNTSCKRRALRQTRAPIIACNAVMRGLEKPSHCSCRACCSTEQYCRCRDSRKQNNWQAQLASYRSSSALVCIRWSTSQEPKLSLKDWVSCYKQQLLIAGQQVLLSCFLPHLSFEGVTQADPWGSLPLIIL